MAREYDPGEPRPPDGGAVIPAMNPPTLNQPPDHMPDPLFVRAAEAAIPASARRDGGEEPETLAAKMLRLIRAADSSSRTYQNFVTKSWHRAYDAFQNKHFSDSKYNSKDYRARTKIFRPKTRAAVRKTMAANSASLFSTTDAMAISPGNEADANARAGAALVQELVNYRTDRTSGRNAIPWFLVCMGAVQDATLTGVVVSKQYWKLVTREIKRQAMGADPETGNPLPLFERDEAGAETPVMETVLKAEYDRPDSVLVPPDRVIIDAGADWTNPAQSAAFLGIKWPMKLDDIRQKEKDPRDPWKPLPEGLLRTGKTEADTGTRKSIRTAREGGIDRYDEVNAAREFETIWVTEWYVRSEGIDYTFYAVGHEHLLTDPKPVDEVYPWNGGDRPVVIGYGALESHKIFPMSPAESWQPLQSEINDLGNLTLDTLKMNIAPIAKVRRGRSVDLDALRVRGPGTNLLMTSLEDVQFDKAPGVDASAWAGMERLNNDFDSLAGQFDQSSVMGARQLNETVGGMRLIAGSANALGEFDQRVVIETWAEPALGQIVKLIQYYEHDETVLALAGDRANLWQKFNVDQITDRLLEAQITTRIDIGVGAGDPQQRIAKFQMAAAVIGPLIKDNPAFGPGGPYEIDIEAVFAEVFGAAGYRDGGKRFLKKKPPQPPPQPPPDPKAETEKLKQQGIIAKQQADERTAQVKLAATVAEIKAKLEMMEKQIQLKDVELALKERELAIRAREAALGMRVKEHGAALSMATAARRHAAAANGFRRPQAAPVQ